MPSTAPKPVETRIVLGVLESAPGVFWLERRPDAKHLAGLLAFPGGKCGPDETPPAALRRELFEELGVDVETLEPLIDIPWVYTEPPLAKHLRLTVYRVPTWRGAVRGREGQTVVPFRLDCRHRRSWLDVLPPANRGILSALCLPPRVAISVACGSGGEGVEAWLSDVAQTAADLARRFGASEALLQLRPVRDLSLEDWRRAVAVVRSQAVRVFVNADLDLAEAVGADGVHLNRVRLFTSDASALAAWQERGGWVTAAVHHADEMTRANEIRVDAVLVSPVLPTASHPGARPLGWAAFGELTQRATMPTYALGGVALENLPQVRAAGGQGIAAIRAFCRSAVACPERQGIRG